MLHHLFQNYKYIDKVVERGKSYLIEMISAYLKDKTFQYYVANPV